MTMSSREMVRQRMMWSKRVDLPQPIESFELVAEIILMQMTSW